MFQLKVPDHTSFRLLQVVLLFIFSQQDFVSAHGFLTIPRARNNEDSCAHCLNAGGPSTVYANNAYTHGICGNNAADHPQNWNAADETQIEAIGQSGDSFLVEVTVTAHHMGFFEFQLCDSPDISEECFRQQRLMRSNCDPDEEGELQCRRWWKPLKQEEYSHFSLSPQGYPDGAPYISGCSYVSFATYFDIPEDVDCTHCVLRWHYVTTNSCTSDDATGEEFWNCADVSIEAPAGQTTTDTTPEEGYESMNERLTTKVPQDLSSMMVDGVDNWRCPNPAYGTSGEYFCGVDGDISGTSGCYAAQDSETCVISFFDGDNKAVEEGTPQVSYCTWSGVCLEQGEGGSDWCDFDEANCNSCGGQWCEGKDMLDGGKDSVTTTTQMAQQSTSTTLLATTTAVATSLQSDVVNEYDYQDVLDKISDMSFEMSQLLSVASNFKDEFEESIAVTTLLDLSFSSLADFENDWTLVTDSGKWNYRNDYKAMMIRSGSDGSSTYAYTTLHNSDSFQYFIISGTGTGKQIASDVDMCRLEVSSDLGESWHSQPVLQLDNELTSGSDTLVYTAEDDDLMIRWIVEGHNQYQTCFLQHVLIKGFDYDDATLAQDTRVRNRFLRGT